MKKTLAILLALTLVFSSVTVAFAEETLPVEAKAVKDLGMLTGAGNGVTNDYLKTAPTRIQAAIMVLRLKGLESAAKAFTGTDNFADADKAAWAKPIMAYLKANKELGWIGDGTNFNPNGEMDAKSYYKVMLETLGYKQNTAEVIGDFTYAGVMDFAATKGLVKNANVLSFTVNDLAVATMETLKATLKVGGKTLALSLVESKAITQEAAIAAGVYAIPADKTAPTIASITMTDLKVAVIKFNEKLDKTSAETAGNYAPAGTPTLGEDGMTVTLNLTTAINENGKDVEFTVKDVKDVLANKMSETKVTIKAFDTTIPVAEKIELTGPQQFKVTFSEPIDATASAAATVLVDNGAYGATATLSGKVLTVSLGSALTAGTYKVKLTGYKDYAGFAAATKEFDLVYAKDVTPVVATVKKSTQTYVVVEFNKAVKGAQLVPASFYHTFTAWQPKAVTQEDGTAIVGTEYYKTVKVAFTDTDPATSDFPIPAGTTNLVVLKSLGTDNDIVDQWGNKMATDATLALTIAADTTAPTIVKVEATKESEVVVTFNEDVDKTSAETVANYVIKDAEGKAITSSITPVYTNTDSVYKTTITVSPALKGSTYTIEVKDVKDVSLAGNKLAAVTLTLPVSDKTAPAISSAVVVENLTATNGVYADAYVYLTFDEAMATTGANSVIDKANYQLDGKALPTAAKVELFGSTNKKVKVTLPGSANTLVGSTRLFVGQLADVVGNKISAFSTAVTVSADTAPTTIASVKTLDKNKLEIVINHTLKTVTTDGIQVKKTSTSAAYDLAAVSFTTSAPTTSLPNGKTTIIATLNSNSAVDNVNEVPYSVAVVDNKLVTETGKKMATVTVFTGVTDGVGPSYASIADATASDYRFEITFNENLGEISSALTATELIIVDKDGKTLTANVDYTTAINLKDLRVTLIGDYAAAKYVGTKFVVSTKSTVTYFGDDLAGGTAFTIGTDNAAKAFTGKEVTLK